MPLLHATLGWNYVLVTALCGSFLAQFIKVILNLFIFHRFIPERMWGAGGMPSSHSAMVTGTALMIGGLYGFDSGLFALSVVVAMIVMYDAAGVRRETGTQATVINQILKDMLLNGKKISDEELKELVGHTPLEVAGGALTGLLVAVIYLLILFA